MSYRNLKAWQLAMDLVERVYDLTRRFPPDERYGLTAQIRRAAVSIPSNIAEGQGRRRCGAFSNHVLIARGSLMEVETQIQIAARLRWIDEASSSAMLCQCDELSRVLLALARSMEGESAYGLPTPDFQLATPD